MFRAPALVLLMLTVADAAWAEDGAKGPSRWLLAPREELLRDDALTRPPTAASDPISRLIEHCKKNPVGIRPIVTLLPPDDDDGRAGLPTIAFFARAKGRTLISLTSQMRTDEGQEVVMQRTVVSDLLAGRRFSLTVYEDHVLASSTARLLGVGTRLTYRPTSLPFRVDLFGALDVSAGATAYLSITTMFGAPPLPVPAAAAPREMR